MYLFISGHCLCAFLYISLFIFFIDIVKYVSNVLFIHIVLFNFLFVGVIELHIWSI